MKRPGHLLLPLLLASQVLTGCAHQVSGQIDQQASTPTQPSADTAPDQVATEAKPDVPPRPFPTDTFYDLLVGELAGMRNHLDIALDKYLTQARVTRDPGVVARATNVAAYAEDREALLEMALLWSDIEPQNLDARSLAALSLARSGRLSEAMTHAIFSLNNGDDESIMSIAVAASGLSPEQRAPLLAEYSKLREQFPDNQTLLLASAMLFSQQEDLQQALNTIDRLLVLAPEQENVLMFKAQLLHQLDRTKEAIAFLSSSLQTQPDSMKLRLQYARLLSEDDLEGAHAQLQLLADKHPRDTELLFTLAMVSRGLDKTDEAHQLLTDLTRHPGTAAAAHFELGKMAEETGNIDAVLFHYGQVRNGPKLLPAAARLSQFMAKHDELNNARLYLHELRLNHPRYSVPLFQIEAELLADHGSLDDARNLMNEAVREHPDNIALLYNRSMLSEQQDDFASSERDLRAILARDADNATALNALGYTLTVNTDRYEEAYQLITRALELNPGDPATTDSLGWVLYQMGNHEEAIVHLREAMKKLPDPEIAAHLGEVLWVSGDREEARAVWQTILDKDPDNTTVLETMERLQETRR